ncbi:P-loop containing nucleoside triphosphate hydrolase protein [Triangularia verruculosa]|uniref:P-loop containing nucleoside triphosphate hydrolase protein n=1 Tax=Triangularia verruculosa TaxID=2587418 RepID=A0AAN6XQ89_9PEZI|nr:P-loop containing nucleoside triphosphate hydrolase protein [Triangularia verruculosa]
MEQFLIDNADRYKQLVRAFKPKKEQCTSGRTGNPDFLISARIRPLLPDEVSQGSPESVFSRGGDTSVVDLHELKKPIRGLPSLNSFSYPIDHIFGPESTTRQMYDAIIKPLVPWAWGGGVSTVFAYGQTGSGKTFTVSDLEGLVAGTLMDGGLEGERKLHMSIVELAGQKSFDLLNSRKQISILEDSFGNTQLAGALEQHITTKSSFLELIEAAASLRRTAPTLKNDSSSRSHAICRIRIENPSIPWAEDGLLYIIDLAGSEAARDKTTHDAARMKEAKEINTSLSVLKDCIRGRALLDLDPSFGSGAKNAYVPFRHSTLTKTLKHVFDPSPTAGTRRSCKTVVVACVNPCLADTSASKNTLRYAEMLRVVVPTKKALSDHTNVPVMWNNEQLREWITKSSGTPPISCEVLAPTESGAQLLRLPIPEFISRCLKTPGVSLEHATAFQSKFWQLHIDTNTHSRTSTTAGNDKPGTKVTRMERLDSSADIETSPEAKDIPFKERIRPGMVVSYHAVGKVGALGPKQMAVVLSRVDAVGERVRDVNGAQVNPPSGEHESGKGERYLCSMVLPAILPGAYDVSLWRQVVVGVEEMEAEVILEWDMATRYHYMTV